jgi:hypothetical protein
LEVDPTKKKKLTLGIAAALILVAAVFTGIWYTTPIPLVSQTADTAFTVSAICQGSEGTDVSDKVDLEEVAKLIASYTGIREFPQQRTSIQQTDDMIQIDGHDAKGPVHVVLTATRGFLYRSGVSSCVKIPNSEELYRELCALIG